MNKAQRKLLGGYAAVRINNEKEFKKVIEFLAIKNCFLANKEPVSKMNYPGCGLFVIYRGDDGFIWWSPIAGIERNRYQLLDVKEMELETVDDQVILEANTTIIDEVNDVNESNMTLVVTEKPEGSTIPSNVDELVALIPIIEAKANVVVTAENYNSFIAKGTGVVPELRRYAKNIKDEKKKIKDSYMASFDEFNKKADMVINALEGAAKAISNNVDIYIQKEKERLRDEKIAKINEVKNDLVQKGMLSIETANNFVFDERWLNKTCSNKKFIEEVNAQFDQLIEKEKIEKQNRELIENTIVNTCGITGIDQSLIKREKYILLMKVGQNLGEITKMITDDVNALKQQKEALINAQQQDAKTINREDKKVVQHEEHVKASEEIAIGLSAGVTIAQPEIKAVVTLPISDEKTGELIGHANDEQVTIKIQTPPPSVPEDKIFSYTYTFEGNCKAILTFNKCLKAFSKVFKSFKYMEVK